MISLKELTKIASACYLLEPPAPEIIIKLLEEIKRLHSKLELIESTSTELTIKEIAKEDVYHET